MRNISVIKGLLLMMLALFVSYVHAQEQPALSEDLKKGFECYRAGDMKNAAEFLEKALPEVEKFSDRYVLVLECLGMAYMELGDDENIRRIMALTEEHNQHELTLPCEEPECMVQRAEYYAATGENTEARSWYLKALALPLEKEDAFKIYSSYGKFLGMTMKEYGQAADYCHAAASILSGMGKHDEEYAGLLYQAALYFYFDGQNEKAIDLYVQVSEFFELHKDDASARKNVALCHEGMARSYFVLQDFKMSLDHYLAALSYYEQEDKENDKYPDLMTYVARCGRYLKDYETAISHYEKALSLYEERGMDDDYSSTATALNRCYALAGLDKRVEEREDEKKAAMSRELDRIISEEKSSLELTRQYLGELSYARSLSTIAGCYMLKEDFSDAVDYFEKYIRSLREAIQYEFRMQNESERMAIWKREQNTLRELKEMLLLLPDGYADEFVRTAAMIYDAELLLKGMLLNSSIEFEATLREHPDPSLAVKYQQTKDNEKEIARLRASLSSEEELDSILRLTEANRELQLEIYQKCADFKDYTEYISYTWQDVKDALKPGDLAVEFSILSVSPLKSDAVVVALLLDDSLSSPLVIPVCGLVDAEHMSMYEGLFDESWPGEVVWGKMRPYIEGKSRVFFSADGIFNKMGIEYLQYDGLPFSEQYEVYRVSSTKELCRERSSVPVSEAVLFGSIDYDSNGLHMADDSQKRAAVTEGFYAFLENTSYEIDCISAILEHAGVAARSYSESAADEDAFLALDNTGAGILHVATHGVCGSDDDMSSDDAMQKSFLVFAGANQGNGSTDGDGLVTAAEVASMNLRKCDLAVLSACETGLGTLGADGVFGLQRGFKNAGVRTLLMSLKEVYDDSTAEMMVRFYRHLMSGSSKREALVRAQKEIREMGYTDSVHWTSFILLDAF